jgi:hypothetical protein
MSKKVQCATHGESQETFVCTHLLGEAAGLGFNRDEPTPENPFPDAWCDDCELIRSAHGGWNDESQKLLKISLVCAGCYDRSRIRNTRTSVAFDDLATLRWKCGSCEEWHSGPCLDFSDAAPYYWQDGHESNSEARLLRSPSSRPKTFLDEDFCEIEGNDFFVRGVIHVPIIGTAETLRWGVWGSLSRENFQTLMKMNDDPKRVQLSPMFSWLSTQIPEYPDTLNLKMYAHIQKVDWRPNFELEPSDHPLAHEYHKGITPERVKQIMMERLRENE